MQRFQARHGTKAGVAALALQLMIAPMADAGAVSDVPQGGTAATSQAPSISYFEQVPCAPTATVARVRRKPRPHRVRHIVRKRKAPVTIAKVAPKPIIKVAQVARKRPVHRVAKRRLIASNRVPQLHKARCEVLKRDYLHGPSPIAAISQAPPNFEPFASPSATMPGFTTPATGGDQVVGGTGPAPFGGSGIPVTGGGPPGTSGTTPTGGGGTTPPSVGVPVGGEPVTPAPEPVTWGLLLSGVAIIGTVLRRGRRLPRAS